MSIRIALVSCVKSKQALPTAACELYTSQLFRALRGYAEKNAKLWYIVSAEHGLLRPDQIIAPYERTLNTMSRNDCRVWAEGVQQQLLQVLPPQAEVILLAGARYCRDLIPFLQEHGFSVSIPFEGLAIGKQLQRLKAIAANGYAQP